jgi:hypothetical protein
MYIQPALGACDVETVADFGRNFIGNNECHKTRPIRERVTETQ